MTQQPNLKPVITVGTIGIDTIITPFGKAEEVLGGSGMFFGVAASVLAPVRLLAVVGEDFDRWEDLRRPGLDLAGVAVRPGRTFRWGGRYHDDINRRDTLFTELGVLEGFVPELPADWRDSRLVFLANVDPPTQLKVLDSLERPEFVITDTMNFWINSDRPNLERVIARTDVLILNDDEARQLTGKLNLREALEQIQALGPRTVVLKKGEHGALVLQEQDWFAVPGLPLRAVVDPTGAGDCFAGGFVGWLARSGDHGPASIRRAMVYGSALASFCCEDFSIGRLKHLTLAQVEERVEQFRRLVHFA